MHLPDEVVEAVRQRMGLDKDDTSKDDAIYGMRRWDLLNRYLEWEGIHDYTSIILAIVDQYKNKE